MNWTPEQLQAIEKEDTNIIVSAGAGSGKTAVLSERVINKLKKEIDIDELLILTFTEAAAKEMKERIRKKIAKEEELIEQLDKIDSAYITTFDSYALSIVKKYNYCLGVSKNVGIVDASIMNLKRDEFLTQIFEELYKEDNKNFLKIINDFYKKDDKYFKDNIIKISNQLNMIYDKENYLNNYLEKYYSDEYIDSKVKEYEEMLISKIQMIYQNLVRLEEYVDSEYYVKVSESLENLFNAHKYSDIKASILPKLPTLPRKSDERAIEIKKTMSANIKELSKLCIYDDTEELKNELKLTKDYTEAVIYILKKLDQKVDNFKKEIDHYEFVDIAKMAISILDQNENIRNDLKHSLKEIMIDEYQDTNDLQELFISKIENNNVYMVGDVKQSIYRFRNANPDLFRIKYEKYSKEDGGIKIDLNKNFRSNNEVLHDINEIFDSIMDTKIGGADYKKSHRLSFGNLFFKLKPKKEQVNNLEVLTYDKDNKYSNEEIEIFTVARDIKNKVENNYQVLDKEENVFRNIQYSDFVILMDRSKSFDLYKKIFEYLNIPLTIYKDETINDSVDLLVIKNILSLILSEKGSVEFKYAFISILRSYLFNINDDKIFEYFKDENYDDSSLMKIINEIDYNLLTPTELLDVIIDKFNFYEKMITVGDVKKHIAVLDALNNLTVSLTEMGYTINDFYNYLDKIINEKERYEIKVKTKEENSGVKIMTIHQSKGLEYHICYYTGLLKEFNLKDLNDKFIFGNDYGFITPVFNKGEKTTFIKELYRKKFIIDEVSERMRLFYVALTRAREKMIIVTSLKDNDINYDGVITDDVRLGYRSFADILTSIKGKLEKNIKMINIDKLGLTKNYSIVKADNFKQSIEKSDRILKIDELNIENEEVSSQHFSKENKKLLSVEQVTNINFGKRIHSIFENIDFKNPNYDGLTTFEKEKVQKFINNDILDNVKNIYKEYEFSYEEDNNKYHGIIDLLLEYNDEFKIVDYKLKNITDDAYLKQLNGYKKYIEKLTNKKVSIYLYSIIEGNLEKLD